MVSNKAFLMASALALATSVVAEGPSIYYPQRIKRDNKQSPAQARADKHALFQQPQAVAQGDDGRDSFLGGLVNDILGGDKPTEDPVVIIVSKTVTVPIGTGILPSTTITPTKSTKSVATRPTDPNSQDPSSSSTETGIIVDPTSVRFPTSSSALTSTPPVVSTPPAGTTTPVSTSTPGGIISIITSILNPDPSNSTTTTPIATPTTSSVIIIPTSSPSTSDKPITTETPISVPPTTVISLPPTTSVEVNTTSIITPISTPTVISVIPTSSVIVPPVNETTSVAPPPPVNATSVAPEPTTTLLTSAVPNSQSWIPTTSMIVEATTMSFTPPATTASSQTSQQTLPSDVPQNILPPKDNTPQEPPKGTVAIQIGFLFPLNYNFVANNTDAAAQIFSFLPQALGAVAGVSADKVPVNKLVPFDTRVDLGYITTLAKINYPKSSVDALKSALWEPSSVFYNNQMDIVRSLTAQVNPKIPLLANNDDEGLNFGGNGANNGAGNTNGGGDSFQGSDSSSQTSKQKATTIGIAVGSLGIGVMYGAAMFIVARRYKRKRALQRRGSMSAGSAEMQFNESGSPALMGGALLGGQSAAYGGVNAGHVSPNSSRDTPSAPSAARAAGISNPVATENSLGWN